MTEYSWPRQGLPATSLPPRHLAATGRRHVDLFAPNRPLGALSARVVRSIMEAGGAEVGQVVGGCSSRTGMLPVLVCMDLSMPCLLEDSLLHVDGSRKRLQSCGHWLTASLSFLLA